MGVSVFMVLWSVTFFFIFGFIIYTFIRMIKSEIKNDRSPRLTIPAQVVSKRVQIGRSGGNMRHTYSRYYVAFEFESGDRAEFCVEGRDYGILKEGDEGKLTFQGTRYLDFERSI